MKSRTITISNHAYNILKRRCHRNVDFDDAIPRIERQLFRKKTMVDIMSFAGILNEKSADDIRHTIIGQRIKIDRELVEQTKQGVHNGMHGYQRCY